MNPKYSRRSIGVYIILFLLLFLSACRSNKEVKEPYRLTLSELQSLKQGDIVLRKGYGMVSVLLESSSGANGVSHCGILTGTYPDYRIIHSISSEFSEQDGVQECTLDDFLNEAQPHTLVVMRYNYAPGAAMDSVANIYLQNRAKFDMSFNIKDNTEIFCSELLYLIIKDVCGDSIFDPLKMDFHFTVFFDSLRFTPIIDHRKIAVN